MSAATVFAAIRATAEQAPGRPALLSEGRRWSYGELVDEVERIAGWLAANGVRPGERVAVLAGNEPEVALVWLAGSRSGVVPVLVNNRLTRAELAPLLARLDARMLLAGGEQHALAADALDGLATSLVPLGDMSAADPFRGPEPDGDGLFEITLTSGTTSLPKLVALAHGDEVRHWSAVAAALGLTADDVGLITTPLFHASGIRNGALCCWLAGGTAAIEPRFSASGFWVQAQRHGATWSCLVETMIAMLMARLPESGTAAHRLRLVIGSGRPELLEEFEARAGARVVQAYGMSECGMVSLVPPTLPPDRLSRLRRSTPEGVPAGWPIDVAQVRIVGSAGEDQPPGRPGQILVRSAGMFREYLGDPAATAATLREGWMHTGDLGQHGPDGELYFIDRTRDVIRRGGENIASKEIEAVLNAHPGVEHSAVFGVPDPVWGQEVWAAVVPGAGAGTDPEPLWQWCTERLARHKIPRFIEFLESLPVTATNRVDKGVLRARDPRPAAADRTEGAPA